VLFSVGVCVCVRPIDLFLCQSRGVFMSRVCGRCVCVRKINYAVAVWVRKGRVHVKSMRTACLRVNSKLLDAQRRHAHDHMQIALYLPGCAGPNRGFGSAQGKLLTLKYNCYLTPNC